MLRHSERDVLIVALREGRAPKIGLWHTAQGQPQMTCGESRSKPPAVLGRYPTWPHQPVLNNQQYMHPHLFGVVGLRALKLVSLLLVL